MTGKTHVAIGVAAGLTLAYGEPIDKQLIIITASSLGSLIPDLDHPKAKLNQKLLFFKNEVFRILFFIALAVGFICIYSSSKNSIFALLSLLSLFIAISSHRGFTHSILGFLIFAYITKTISVQYSIEYLYQSVSIGYLLHLFADFLTPQGIKLFYPLNINISAPIIINPKSGIDELIFILASTYSLLILLKLVV